MQISDHEYEPIPLTGKEWIVTSTYTDKARKYKAQLMRKIDGEYIANSPIFELVVNNSIYGNETIKEVVPPNFKNAYDNMVDITNQIKEAFENGDFNGNGIVSIEKESTNGLTDTYKIIFSDGKETKFNVTNGKGIVSIEKTNTQENVDTYTITFNDETTSTFTITNGIDGYSPQVSVQQEIDGVTISVTDNEGTTKAKVLNGTNGKDGINGTTPNIQIGTVTTLEPDQQATVERTGDNENPVFNFGIPKGRDGEVKDPLQFAIKETTTGNPTIISDSADWRLQKLNIYGQSEQARTTGTQLLDPSLFDSNDITRNGIRFVKNSDGSIAISGTATEFSTYNLGLNRLENGTYYINGSKNNAYVYANIKKADSESFIENNSFSIDGTETSIRIYIQVNPNFTVNAIIYPMLNLGNTAKPFEPYTGGKPSPSPDYPQDILSKEVSEIKFNGKNLFDISKVNNFDSYSNGYLKDIFKLPSGKYVISMGNLSDSERKNGYFSINVGSYSYWFIHPTGANPTLPKGVPFTLTETTNISCNIHTSTREQFDTFMGLLKDNIQIEFADYATEIEPYKEQVVNLTSPITLRGVSVDKGGNVTIDGQQYISDVICEKDGIIGVDRNVIVLSPSDGIVFKQSSDISSRAIANAVFKVSTPPKSASEKSLSTHFVWKAWGTTSNNKEWLFSINMNAMYISPPSKEGGYTKEELESLVNSEWTKIKNDVKFSAQLSKPTFEPLPEADQEAIRKLKTFYPNTVIQTECWNEVEFVADTKLYIEKKINEVKGAILNVQANMLKGV